MKLYANLFLPVLFAGLCGCYVPAESEVETTAIDTLNRHYHIAYKKIEGASVSLEALPNEVVVLSGSPATMDLALTNTGSRTLDIPEWYQEDLNNFIIHFRPLKSNETPEEAINAEWYVLTPDFRKDAPPARRHLSLAPGNTAICTVPLDFIKDIPAENNMLFIAFAEFNLISISATSPMFLIVSQSSNTEN